MSRDYTIRKELSFHFAELFEVIKVTKRSGKDKIIKCVNSMFETNFDSNTNINKTIRLPYQSPKSKYLILYDEEVDYLLTCNVNIDKYNLFNTYAAIKRHIHYELGTAFPSIEGLMSITGIASNNSINKYVEILEGMELIKCYREDRYIISGDSIRRPNNTYELVKYKYKITIDI